MARGNKITIVVTESRRNSTITWSASGASGNLVLSQEKGSLPDAGLPNQGSVALYWADVLNKVVPHLT